MLIQFPNTVLFISTNVKPFNYKEAQNQFGAKRRSRSITYNARLHIQTGILTDFVCLSTSFSA